MGAVAAGSAGTKAGVFCMAEEEGAMMGAAAAGSIGTKAGVCVPELVTTTPTVCIADDEVAAMGQSCTAGVCVVAQTVTLTPTVCIAADAVTVKGVCEPVLVTVTPTVCIPEEAVDVTEDVVAAVAGTTGIGAASCCFNLVLSALEASTHSKISFCVSFLGMVSQVKGVTVEQFSG